MKKPITVAVSGGFDPIHPGHIRMFKEAKALGDKLIVILNNDNWLIAKKGFKFMGEGERKEVLEAIRYVDEVVLTKHLAGTTDLSVSEALLRVKPDVFANGGDRTKKNIPEVDLCNRLSCRMVYNVGQGGKVQSSSWLVEKAIKNAPRKVSIIVKKRRI
ncbi:MAG: hypothetical protein A3B10_02135 [Candidatus Doudnabacteria bacterium RIFCSPLOWO2_01_FULL_44_21]|uniref:Cytidyltransferase-like domain-containing protein n=1 Tax=Candidatus Doudnabacteria bacterium RIFCSPLOWO2_01_FULL_44_21 TaxID=1817841 RepID=A0A1F5Q5A5_9BACT|nr:MAG: hypothetical protein A3B95_00245 [Candidatus Doudnabacteria bacterium RIFCSPHIGHO2_02_FULL_43_13b]OGE97371.1 MAG: hypothetical protein A3B10_02135 [Candidatus Doudnabacteria bacterium RIFCSPLOWO2_01_FULL_44_21]